ncbi:MAG: arginine--tRNA ligase [Acidobacteria bacterium]|nr:arginine--tRNA ligase [Acidobacteriota bacterium]
MQTIKENIARQVVDFLVKKGVSADTVSKENLFKRPEREGFGDLALPCFPFARQLRMGPPQIAAELKTAIGTPPGVEKIEVVGGYLNFHLDKGEMFRALYRKYRESPDRMLAWNELAGQKVLVEFSSPNIAKPFSIGHLRSTVIGNFLQNLFRSLGAEVIAVNHIGDWGTQFGKLIVAFEKWGSREELAENPVKHLLALYVRFHREAETAPELEEAARLAFKRLEDGGERETELWQTFRELSLKEFNRTYGRLNVRFDKVLGEAFYRDKLQSVIDILKERGLLSVSENAVIVNLDEFDMPPCLIQKSDGASLYATRDIAAAVYRHDTFGFDKALYVVGAEQALHFRQFFKVLELAGFEWAADMEHIPFGLYRFQDGKMSTRKGKVIFLEEVLDEAVKRIRAVMEEKNPDIPDSEREKIAETLGTSAIIFHDLKNDRVKDIKFSWDEVLSMDGDSGPYIAYSYVRCRGILDKSRNLPPVNPEQVSISHPDEALLIQKLSQAHDTLLLCAKHRKSHFLAQYLLELTHAFHGFYHHCRVIGDDNGHSAFRLALVELTSATLKAGAGLMGMQLPERM